MENENGEGAAKVITAQTIIAAGRREVDIRALKRSVASKFGSNSLLRRVVSAEPDLIPITDVVGKVGTWLAVLREDLEDRP